MVSRPVMPRLRYVFSQLLFIAGDKSTPFECAAVPVWASCLAQSNTLLLGPGPRTPHACRLFSARFRLPAHYTREQHLFHVEKALHVLQLEDVRDELVGDEETRGIRFGSMLSQ